MKSKSKRSIFNIILLVMLILLWGYNIKMYIQAENERKAEQALFDVASANAVGYVREKYGFEPEILDVSDDDLFELYSRYYDDVRILKLKADGREFYVLADCLEENSYCVDDYQYEEIQSAAIDEILKGIPDGEIISIAWGGHEDTPYDSARYIGGFNKYYDGGNLDEFLELGSGYVEMIFVNENISESGIPERLEKMDVSYVFNSFDTAEHMEEYLTKKKAYESVPHLFSEYNEPYYKRYAPHITDHADSKSVIHVDNSSEAREARTEKISVNYNTEELEDFKYCCFPTDSSGKCLTEMKQSDFVKRRDYYGRIESLNQPLSKAYELDGNSDRLYIYYPIKKLDGLDVDHIGAVWYSNEGTETIKIGQFYEKKKIGTERAEIYGDYAVFILHENTSGFMLVNLMEQSE